MGLFNKNKPPNKSDNQVNKATIKPLNYPPKIILGWAKAIEGNQAIAEWLSKNGYEELVVASWAIRLKNDARKWLAENGYIHLMAFIHASEGDEKAIKWLKDNRFDLLYNMALAIDGENENFIWVRKNAAPDIFILTQTIKRVKDEIEYNHNNIHNFGVD